MKPRIAIPVPNSKKPLYVRIALPQYERAVRQAGGEPVIIEVNATPSEIAQAVKACDGVLLPGSPADVDPEKYGATRRPETAPADPARDNTDELLLQDAYNMRKPVFGICYGVQSLNVWRTGTLSQNLPMIVNHDPGRNVTQAHKVEVDPKSGLAGILRGVFASHVGRGEPDRLGSPRGVESERAAASAAAKKLVIAVNSSHHQAAERLGDGLRLAACCPEDGVKEAVEGTSPDHFVLGVQWHPERTYDSEPASRAMFLAFIEAAARWHQQQASKQQDFESVR
jgi:putative glutamine amidotransferase